MLRGDMEAELPGDSIDEFKKRVYGLKLEDVDTVPEYEVFKLSEFQRHIQQTVQLHVSNLGCFFAANPLQRIVDFQALVRDTDHLDGFAEFKVIEQTGITTLLGAGVKLSGIGGKKSVQPHKRLIPVEHLKKAPQAIALIEGDLGAECFKGVGFHGLSVAVDRTIAFQDNGVHAGLSFAGGAGLLIATTGAQNAPAGSRA
jgi:hypothetical protein